MMYAAHSLSYIKFINTEHQKTFPIWESIYLIFADIVDEAYVESELIGNREVADNIIIWEGHEAIITYIGVRRLFRCQMSFTIESDQAVEKNALLHGMEITYLQYVIASENDLQKILNQETVTIELEE